MRSDLLALLVLAGCGPIDTQLTISRGAPAIPAGIGEAEQVRPVSLPARPLLNRYDLLNHYHPNCARAPANCPPRDPSEEKGRPSLTNFVDYLAVDHLSDKPGTRAYPAAPTQAWLDSPAEQWRIAEHLSKTLLPSEPTKMFDPTGSGTEPASTTVKQTAVSCHREKPCLAIPATDSAISFVRRKTDSALFAVAYRNDDSWVLDADAPATLSPEAEVTRYRAATISEPLFSFIHLTDVQLREATARVGSPKQSKGLDKFVDSFEHDFEQDLFVDVVLDALVRTINKTVRKLSEAGAQSAQEQQLLPPTFVIHTGDAIDVGLMSELRTFHRIMDRLELPWLSAIGNHDVLAFGNLIPCVPITTDALAYGAKSNLRDKWWWKWLGRHLANGRWSVDYDQTSCPGCEDELVATGDVGTKFAARFIEEHARHAMAPRRFGPACPKEGGDSGKQPDCATTRDHGFDLRTQDDVTKDNGTPPGYYAFDLRLGKQANGGYRYILRTLVLNTDEFGDPKLRNRGGEGGYVSEDQLKWLKEKQLKWLEDKSTTDNRLMLVFGHHPLSTIRRDLGDNKGAECDQQGGSQARLRQLLGDLAKTGRFLGYFAGHKHGHEIALQKTCDKKQAFWEVQTGSIIGFPQEARWVTLRVLSDRLGFLELIPFGQQVVAEPGSPLAETLARAERGAKRDKCRKRPCIDGEPIRDGKHGAVRLFVELPAKPAGQQASQPAGATAAPSATAAPQPQLRP